MSAAISCAVDLAGAAQGKLWAEASRPNSELRLLVGHANLLDLLIPELTDNCQTKETPSWRGPEAERGKGGGSKFVEDFEESRYYYSGIADAEPSSDPDYSSDSTSDSEDSDDDAQITDATSPQWTLPDQTAVSDSRIWMTGDKEEEPEVAGQLKPIRSPVSSGIWSPEFGRVPNGKPFPPSTPQAALVPSVEGTAEILRQEAHDPGGCYPPPRSKARLAANNNPTSGLSPENKHDRLHE